MENNDAMNVGSQPIEMNDIEKSFMHEIDKFLYWSNGYNGKEFAYNTNVLEVFRKHADLLLVEKDVEIKQLQDELQRATMLLDNEQKKDLMK